MGGSSLDFSGSLSTNWWD